MSSPTSRDDARAPRGGKLRSIGVVVACVAAGAVGGPRLLGDGTASGAPAADPAADVAGSAAAPSTTVSPGPVVVLDPVTINLADGRLLRVGLALQLGADAEAGDGHGGDDTDPTKGYAREVDAAIGVLGGHTMSTLVEPRARDGVKADLAGTLRELSHGQVVDVYFHQFVMQ